MTKPRLIIVAGLFALGPVGYLIAVFPPTTPLNKQNCARLQSGMSRSEVETILGGPPGDYTVGQLTSDVWLVAAMPKGSRLASWIGHDGEILVCFDKDGRLVYDLFLEVRPVSVFERIGRWRANVRAQLP